MVRLGVASVPMIDVTNPVSIPVWFDWECSRLHNSFSPYSVSIPVWFDWESSNIPAVPDVFVFQFQYGSIGSGLTRLLDCRLTAFQFQYGSIGSGLMGGAWWLDPVFQFQYGSIGSESPFDQEDFRWMVSIPVWFDWEFFRIGDMQHESRFQFQYGSIGRQVSDFGSYEPPLFQFQYGSIGSAEGREFITMLNRFNSSMVRLGAL